MEALKLKFPPAAQVVFYTLIIWLFNEYYPLLTVTFPSNALIATLFMGVGIVIIVLGGVAFRKAKTTVDPRYPNNSTALVVIGVYQYTRNPMYVGMLLSLMGVVVYLGNLSGLFIIPIFIWTMNELQIKWEEQALLEKFGEPYREYMVTVRRWL